MAAQYWGDMSLLIGSIDVAGSAKDVMLKTDVAVLDTTPLSTSGWVTCIGGNKSGTVEMTLMQDLATTALDDTLWPLLGVADTVKSVVTASADGSVAYLLRGIPLSYTPIEGDPGGLAMAKISGQSSTGPVVRGQLIHPSNVTRTSSSTGTITQLGAVAAGKSLYAALHVISASGSTPTLAVKIQSAALVGFGSPTDRITFTSAGARTSEWKSVAGAITDQFWRVSYTIGGSSPVFAFAVTAGIL